MASGAPAPTGPFALAGQGGAYGGTNTGWQRVDFEAGRVARVSSETRGASAAVAAVILV